MEIAQLVLEYFKVLTWPLIVIVALLRFTPAIRNLLGRLSEISSPDGYTARFDRQAGEAAALAEGAVRTDAGENTDRTEGADDEDRDDTSDRVAQRLGWTKEDVAEWARVAARMARVRPVAMMLEAWSKLEDLLLRSAALWELGIGSRPLSVGDLAGLLAQLQTRGLSPDFFRVGVELAVLREQLDKIIEEGRQPSTTSAQDFIAACGQLMEALLGLQIRKP
ncbi:hypothetical protein ACQP2K_01820 [Microbispora siamensis]